MGCNMIMHVPAAAPIEMGKTSDAVTGQDLMMHAPGFDDACAWSCAH